MDYILNVCRTQRGSSTHTWQKFLYHAKTVSDTVATALAELGRETDLRDIDGNPARKIEWECSCMQRKCGACAMRINRRPQLACDAKLADMKDGTVTLEPLLKFPVICDLIVDRSILYENLRTISSWMKEDARQEENWQDLAYLSSTCIQCGCCLEICPNFYAGGTFFGMSVVPVTTRLISQMSPEEYRELAKQYEKHVFSGCGKSLACRDVCPRGIDTEHLLVNSNALAVWKRSKKRGELK